MVGRAPGRAAADGSLTICNVVLPTTDDVVDVAFADGRVAAITPSDGEAEWLLLPPLADLHVHANRAYTPPAQRPRGLDDAVRNVAEVFARFSVDDYRRHAALLFDKACCNGTTRLRTHADIDSGIGLAAVEGSLLAARDVDGKADIDVVAFAASASDPATTAGAALLRESVEMGARFLGAAPAFCDEPRASIDALLDLAVELGVPVDVHLDEHLDANRCQAKYLAQAVLDRGLGGRVTLSHGCTISVLSDRDRERVIRRLADAMITLIALPRTNLYLQDAGGDVPQRRGIAPLRQLVAAGVPVRVASDNVRDVFYPYGDADLLGVAMDGILASQMDEPGDVIAAICDGNRTISVGDSADAVLLRGTSVDGVLADPPAERWVIRGGELRSTSG